jgi:UDP-3-O-[3-hydroxymyristoyl] N-acetylglucosamine deacetylase
MTWGVPWGVPAGRQTTLRDHVTVAGVGVHSGLSATITLHPAEPNTGIVFVCC